MTKVIFLTYINRSGSTFFANSLSRHNDICILPEAEILISLLLQNPTKKCLITDFKIIIENLKNDVKFKYWQLNDEIQNVYENNIRFYDLFKNILIEYKKKNKPHAKFVLFKGTKLNYLLRNLIELDTSLLCFSITRDVRAVYLSQKNSIGSTTGKPMSTNPYSAAVKWKKFIMRNILNKNNFPEIFYEFRYEDFIKKHNKYLKWITAILGINHDYSHQEFHVPENQLHLHSNINKTADKSRINRWKNLLERKDIYILECITRKELIKYEYDLLYLKVNRKCFFNLYYQSKACTHFYKKYKSTLLKMIRYQR